jgi:hypothetical protein
VGCHVTSLQDGRPCALERVLALAGGRARAAGPCLAADVQAWFASPQQGLSAAVETPNGADDAAGALARLAPSSLRIVASLAAERTCWAEIIRLADREHETCIAGLTCNDDGDVSRLVWLRAPLVPASGLAADAAVPDGRPVIEAYFADLMRSKFRAASAHFTADTIYSHPPYGAGTERVLVRGRDALWRAFATERGTTPARQIITGYWQRQCRVFIEGVVEGIPHGGTFVSTAEITSEGEIARYVAFYCATRIPPGGHRSPARERASRRP